MSATRPPPVVNGKVPTILVVDDDPDLRALYRHFLDKNGVRPVLAADGTEAIRLYQEYLPDLVLMDAIMPGLDGFETSLALRGLYPAIHVPIIMVTGLADEESVDAAFRSGAEDYIAKPVNWAVLRHRIRAILNHQRMEKTLRESEERFRSLAESSDDAIISADVNGCIVFWNKGAERCFGYGEEDVLHRSLTILMPERFCHAHQQALANILATGQGKLARKTLELIGLHKEGREFPIEIALSTWLNGDARFFSAIIRDISKRKQLEAERELAMQTRIAISALLETALEPLTMAGQLTVALEILHTLPRWSQNAKSTILLNREEIKSLSLTVWKGWDGHHPVHCSKVPHGACQCGHSALTRELIFSSSGEHRHPDCAKGSSHYGIYSAPILFQQRLLGVLNLYLPQGHDYHAEEASILHTIAQTLATIIERRRMEEALEQSYAVLKETKLEIIHRLGMASEFRDNETGLHIIRMSRYAEALGREAQLDERRCNLLLNAAPMHDVGKIGIADGILLKPGRLTTEEFEIMKTHAAIGAHMLFGHDDEPLKTAHIIALTHHERWDGKGYPHGLAGEDIPLEGRICAIADVFDALTSERPYKRAWAVDKAVDELRRGAGSQFDPQLVEQFIQCLPQILLIKEQFQEDPDTCPAARIGASRHGYALFIQWDARLELGIPEVDQEHKHLVSLVNKLYGVLGATESDKIILAMLGDIEDYAVDHFSNEEALLLGRGDPWLSEHREEHAMFQGQLVDFRTKCRQASEEGVGNMMVELRKLLMDHLVNVDKRSFAPNTVSGS